MTTINPYFTQGTSNEQYLIEDIIIESLKIYGKEMFYIPRTLVSKDDILGEDRLSKFESSFPIEMYIENVEGFDGQQAFIQKFGLMMEQSATFVVARRRWEQLVGRFGMTTIPTRPNEGDLIYFPMTKGLFEIKYVKHQDPFYQLGKLYVYKLQVELFQYASERIDTCNPDIDIFESLKSCSVDIDDSNSGGVFDITIVNGGIGYTHATVNILSNTGSGAIAEAVIEDGIITEINMVNVGAGYKDVSIIITGDGTNATATGSLRANVDLIDSYGDNNKFKSQGSNIIFDESNPFGEF